MIAMCTEAIPTLGGGGSLDEVVTMASESPIPSKLNPGLLPPAEAIHSAVGS